MTAYKYFLCSKGHEFRVLKNAPKKNVTCPFCEDKNILPSMARNFFEARSFGGDNKGKKEEE